jgi:hypothetical protein
MTILSRGTRSPMPYRLAKQSDGRISLSTAYRLNRSGGRAQNYDSDLLEAMCDVFGLRDLNVLFERDQATKGKRG